MPQGKIHKEELLNPSSVIDCNIAPNREDILSCFIDTTSVNSFLVEFKIGKPKNVDPSNHDGFLLKKMVKQQFFKPSGFEFTKVRRSDQYIAILLKNKHKGAAILNDYDFNKCRQILIVYKYNHSQPYIAFSCSDIEIFNSDAPFDFELVKMNKNYLWVTEKTEDFSGKVTYFVKGFTIGPASVMIKDKTLTAKDLKIEYIGLHGTPDETKALELSKVARVRPGDSAGMFRKRYITLIQMTLMFAFFGLCACSYYLCSRIGKWDDRRKYNGGRIPKKQKDKQYRSTIDYEDLNFGGLVAEGCRGEAAKEMTEFDDGVEEHGGMLL